MKPLHIVVLAGGLGNQLFKYFYAVRLKLDNPESTVLIDTMTGFWTDYQYKRTFELDSLVRNIDRTSFPFACFILFIRVCNKLLIKLLKKTLTERIICESGDGHAAKKSLLTIHTGYYQNYANIASVATHVRSDMNLLFKSCSLDDSTNFKKLNEKIRRVNSVGICLRFYEESVIPNAHHKGGSGVTIKQVQAIIDKIQGKITSPVFFLFCQERNYFTDSLKFDSEPVFVDHSSGYDVTLERLRSISLCKHHIINNSTFYWWGAFLADQNRELSNNSFDQQDRIVFCSNTFVFDGMLKSDWSPF